MINTFLGNRALRETSQEVAAEMAAQPCPTEVAKTDRHAATRLTAAAQ